MKAILYGLLGQVAIREGKSVHLWVYTLAKTLDAQVQGRGWVDTEDLAQLYPRSRRNLLRIIQQGEGTFWRLDSGTGRLYLSSLQNVGIALGTTLGDPVYVPTTKIQTLQKFKAANYAAFYAQGKIISRGKLSKLYGVTKQTLIRWEKLAGIIKVTNLGKKTIKNKKDAEHLPGIDRDGVWHWGDALYWQIPNTYYLDDPDLAPRHVVTNRRIRHALKAEKAPARRLYYDRRERAMLRVMRGEQPFAYVCTRSNLGGRRVWEFVHA